MISDDNLDKTNMVPYVVAVLGLVLVIIAVLLMTHMAYKLHSTMKKGERMRKQCGSQYMERESERYFIYKEYAKFSKLFIPILWLFLTSWFLFGLATWDTGSLHLQSHRMIYHFSGLLYVVGFVIVLIVMKVKTSTIKSNIKSNINYESKVAPVKKLIIAWYCITIIFCIFPLIVQLRSEQSTAIDIGFVSLTIIFITVVFVLCYLFFVKFNDVHNKFIANYRIFAETQLQESLKNMTTNAGVVGAGTTQYLKQNVMNAHPDLTREPNIQDDPYSNELYSYVMHANGSEAFNDDTNTAIIGINELKSYIATNFYKSLNEPDIDAMGVVSFEIVKDSKVDVSTLTVEKIQYTPASAIFRDVVATMLHGGLKDPDLRLSIPRNDVEYILSKYEDDSIDVAIREEILKPIVTTVSIPRLNEILSKHIQSEVLALDILNSVIFYCKSNNYETQYVVTIKSRLSAFLTDERIKHYLDTVIQATMQENDILEIQQIMAQMRDTSPTWMKYNSKFINVVKWVNIIVWGIVFYYLYHKLMNWDKSLFLIVPLMLILIIVVVTYFAWFTGSV